MKDCIFCKIANKEISSKFIYENDNFFSIFDVAPQVKGHALVIPKRHFKTILDIPNTMASELTDAIKNTSLKVLEKENAQGFNLLNNAGKSAGQLVDHVHFHILPRKNHDGLHITLRK